MTAQLPSQDDKPANPESSKSLFQTGPLRLVRKDADSVIEVPQSELTPKVQSAMRFLMSEVSRLKNELAEAKERVVSLENLADEDPLVPILNRRGFVRELERTISYAKRYAIDTSILYIDLDEFKKINDTYGHQAGDLALKHAGSYLVEKVRASDTVARIGGDEFAIILKHVRLKDALQKAKQLEKDITRQPLKYEDIIINLQLTVGAAELTMDDSCSDIMDRADKAMYEIRSQRRGGIGS